MEGFWLDVVLPSVVEDNVEEEICPAVVLCKILVCKVPVDLESTGEDMTVDETLALT